MKNTKNNKNYKDKLEAKKKLYTQQEIARKLKKSQTLVSMMINGKRTPTPEFIKAISNL